MERVYACIDLKSFYASCECVERKLDPMTTNLVVADMERTEKTICLAVSPSLKKYGLSGRSRLYEVISKIKKVNEIRKKKINNQEFIDKSINDNKLKLNPYLAVDYIIAKPRMKMYLKYSSEIYSIYLSFLSKEDIFVYSIDEVFCDLTNYLSYYKMNAKELVSKMIMAVYNKTGITATGGVGSNLYLAKVAMDILAKHIKPNSDGVRIAQLDVLTYRKTLWNHQPLTDFWRVGKGYAKKLFDNKIYTMGDICLESLNNENKLFQLFGVNAELLIDHAWGYEPCTIQDIKKYKPENISISSGQVLHEAYSSFKTKVIITEMVDDLVLNMVSRKMVSNMIILTIGYDVENLNNNYQGIIKKDYYGRNIPKEAHGTIHIDHFTSSTKLILNKTMELYQSIVNPNLLIRRINLTFTNLISKDNPLAKNISMQLDLFAKNDKIDLEEEEKEDKVQNTILDIKNKYGKNALIKGIDLMDGATTINRNKSIGGHKA